MKFWNRQILQFINFLRHFTCIWQLNKDLMKLTIEGCESKVIALPLYWCHAMPWHGNYTVAIFTGCKKMRFGGERLYWEELCSHLQLQHDLRWRLCWYPHDQESSGEIWTRAAENGPGVKGPHGKGTDKAKFEKLIDEYRQFKRSFVQHYKFSPISNETRFGQSKTSFK